MAIIMAVFLLPLFCFLVELDLSEEDGVSDETFFLLKFIAKNSINILKIFFFYFLFI